MIEKHVDASGYTTVKDIDGIFGKKDAWVPEHRLEMSKFIGVPLPSGAHVHHINGNKSDNRIENLAIVSARGHNNIHKTIQTKVIIEKECANPDFIGKEKWLKIRCPQCGRIFYRPLSQSSLKREKLADFCDGVCCAKFNEAIINNNGITVEMRNAIDSSVICHFQANGRFMRNFCKHPLRDYEVNDQGLFVQVQYSQ